MEYCETQKEKVGQEFSDYVGFDSMVSPAGCSVLDREKVNLLNEDLHRIVMFLLKRAVVWDKLAVTL